jgi:hypothetical protein
MLFVVLVFATPVGCGSGSGVRQVDEREDDRVVMKIPPVVGTHGMEILLSSAVEDYKHYGLTHVNDQVYRVRIAGEYIHPPPALYVQVDSLRKVRAACLVFSSTYRRGNFHRMAESLENSLGAATEVETRLSASDRAETTAMMWWDSGVMLQLINTQAGVSRLKALTDEPRRERWCDRLTAD